MPDDYALFFTTGLSDLKFVGEDGGLLELTKYRHPTAQLMGIRAVHQALLDLGPDGIAVYPFDTDAAYDARRQHDISFMQPDQPIDIFQQGCVNKELETILLKYLDDGRLLLAAPKMETAWSFIRRERGRVIALVGFQTRRDDNRDEPIASETLIFNAISRSLAPAPDYTSLFPYVTGRERLEDADKAIISRIEHEIIRCKAALEVKQYHPVLALSGGIPGIKDVVRKAVELHIGPALSTLRTEEDSEASFHRAPQDIIAARRHALGFVRSGAFVEAAAMLLPFADEQYALRQWLRAVAYTARLFDDNPVAAYARGLPPPTPVEHWQNAAPPPFLVELAARIYPGEGMPQRRCLLVGLRAEAALRSGRWSEAINSTVTFLDAARRDLIERKLGAVFVSDDTIRLNGVLSEADRTRLCETPVGREGTPLLSGCTGPEAAGEQHMYRVESTGPHDTAWCNFLGGALRQVDQLLGQFDGQGQSARRFRNRNTHNILDAESLRQGLAIFEQKQLWTRRADGRLSLLDADQVRAVIRQVGLDDGNALDKLILELETILLSPAQGS